MEGAGEQRNWQKRSAQEQKHQRMFPKVPPTPQKAHKVLPSPWRLKALGAKGGREVRLLTKVNRIPVKTKDRELGKQNRTKQKATRQ